MIARALSSVLKRFSKIYPVVGIFGPRQSGKTTLARTLFDHLPYVSLENLDIRLVAQQDPRNFLQSYQEGAIFDEIQNVPELLSYLQQIVDDNPAKGRYVITGSQNFALGSHIAQSLSGRVGMTSLLPLSLTELEFKGSLNWQMFTGGYPALHNLAINPVEFFPSYIQTYLERDVRQLKNIENLGKFQVFLKLCAGRVGQIINLSSLAQDCGISHTAARQWLTILEASYIIFHLQPFYKNFSKRLIKAPKLYFYDTGLACSLLGIEKESQLDSHYLRGALYENLVILELLKGRLNRGLLSNLYFWRDQTGHEIDCIAEWGGESKAIEVKIGSTIQPDFFSNLRFFSELSKQQENYLVYNGSQKGMFSNTHLVPLKEIGVLFKED